MSAEYNITGIGSAIHSDTYRDDPTFRAMINDIVITYCNSDECDGIYGYMYGTPWTLIGGFFDENKCVQYKNHWFKHDEVIHIDAPLNISKHKDAFFYRWGWPGPDINKYKFEDYGITWAFSAEEIQDVSIEEWESRYERTDQQDV